MEDLSNNLPRKYQVTIHFEMDEHFMSLVPPHRIYINSLIEKDVIDYYSVSMETQRCWMILNANGKKQVYEILAESPLRRYWKMEVDELFVYDARHYRLPGVQLN
jgi:hypothetical protein